MTAETQLIRTVRRLRREAGRHRPENHSYHENHLIYSLCSQTDTHLVFRRSERVSGRTGRRRLQERQVDGYDGLRCISLLVPISTNACPYATYLNRIGRSTAATRQPQARRRRPARLLYPNRQVMECRRRYGRRNVL